MNVFVTGAEGYIGRHTVRALAEAEHTVVPMRGNLLDVCVPPGVDAVVHLAALVDVAKSAEYPSNYWRTNVEGTRVLLDAMRNAGCERIVFASSVAAVSQHTSPYAATKAATETMLLHYTYAYKLSTVILQYCNVAGEDHSSETHLIPCALRALRDDSEFVLKAPGVFRRDYVHVADVAAANVAAVDLAFTWCDTYDVCTGKRTQTIDVLRLCEVVTGKRLRTVHSNVRAAEPTLLYPEYTAFLPGWRPTRDLEEIVCSAWEFIKREKEK